MDPHQAIVGLSAFVDLLVSLKVTLRISDGGGGLLSRHSLHTTVSVAFVLGLTNFVVFVLGTAVVIANPVNARMRSIINDY
jgi:hypothetical protein